MFPQSGNMDMGDLPSSTMATNITSGPPDPMKYQMMMANQLRQGAQQQPQGSMVGGNYVAPSATQQLAPAMSKLGFGMAMGQPGMMG